jgi:hypothetical protein
VKQNTELIAALVCVLLLTAAYLAVAALAPPRPSSLLGHGIGILGSLLMLATETLYSWRKTRRRAQWGRTSTWLSAHIFTGIVGPYLVFLHTGFRFAGLAGATFWITFIVVCSGFVGRYIYTAIPRTTVGTELGAAELETSGDQAETELKAWLSARPAQIRALAEGMRAHRVALGSGIAVLLSGPIVDLGYRRKWRRAVQRLDAADRQQAVELGVLLERCRLLQRQAITLASARQGMAIWHAMHVPLSVALFVALLLHAVVALYFS